MNIEVEGIVIRRIPYKENSCMMNVLTKDGLVSFMARGILNTKSKNASSCILFSTSIFSLISKNDKYFLQTGKLVSSNYEIMSSLKKISCLELCAEATLKFQEDLELKNLYPYLVKLIDLLKIDYDVDTLTAIYLAQIIKNSGYSLEYNSCVLCGNKENIVNIDYEEGGFICSDCLKTSLKKFNDLDSEFLQSFRYVFMVDSNNLDHYILNKDISKKLISDFVNYLCTSYDIKELKAMEMYNIA